MRNATLFVSSLAMAAFHSLMVSSHRMVDPFFVFIIMRYCLTSIYTNCSTSTFVRLYYRMIIRETMVADVYFMVKTNTLPTAGGFALAAMIGYIAAGVIKHIQCQSDPLTTLIYWTAFTCMTVAHALIIKAF
jgi:hypothetical protein